MAFTSFILVAFTFLKSVMATLFLLQPDFFLLFYLYIVSFPEAFDTHFSISHEFQ